VTGVVSVIDFAADHVLTVVWLKATLFITALMVLHLMLGRLSAAARSMLWTVSVAALVPLAAMQYLTPQAGPVLVDFPTFLFRHSVGDVAGLFLSRPLPWPSGLGWAADVPVARWLGALWMLGATILLARLAYQIHVLRRAAAAAETWPAVSVAGITVGLSPSVDTPLTFGWRRPHILLPPDARDWPDERLAAVLAHERAHIRRRDFATLMLTEVVKALYWINPIAWRLAAMVRTELECACDDAVLRAGVPPAEYVRHLLGMAAGVHHLPHRPALQMARPSLFRVRVHAILDASVDRGIPSWRGIIGAALFCLVLAGGLAGSSLWACGETSAAAHTAPHTAAQTG
jgi:beta-lactamase regulating signal transducer with metallopeptidase domain